MDQRLLISVATVVAVLVVSVHQWYSLALAAGILVYGLPRLRKMAKDDPLFFDVFRRHVRQRGRGGVYSAQAHYTAIAPTVKKHLR